jgi:lipopolysaccharide export system permease protein
MRKMVQLPLSDTIKYSTIADYYAKDDAIRITKAARTVARNVRDRIKSRDVKILTMSTIKAKFGLRLHQQFSWALICIVFLFIGAPMGSIVRKGGYGYPLLVAIIFFMLFIIMNIMGEKLNSNQVLPPALAAWLPNLLLIPAALVLTFMALKDRKMINLQSIIAFFKKD